MLKKCRNNIFRVSRGQSAIEYLVLLGVVTAVALVGFKTFLPKSRSLMEEFYNVTAKGVVGDLAGNFTDADGTYSKTRKTPHPDADYP